MKKYMIIALCLFFLCGCSTFKKYTMLDYYEYSRDFFNWTHSSWTIGDDDKYAYMSAIDMYARQPDLDRLKKELSDSKSKYYQTGIK